MPVKADPFPASFSGTRQEGSVDCVARLPEHLRVSVIGNYINISSDMPGRVVAWKGNPSYTGISKEFQLDGDTLFKRGEIFGNYEGKLVFQLFNGDELADLNIIYLEGGNPWLISKSGTSPLAEKIPANMVLVPGGKIAMNLAANDEFIPYPVRDDSTEVIVDSFLIDIYPVTNEEYHRFVTDTR
ncbi:MAG: hypothetical protein E4G95_05090, partial [Bacteroidia bacterium]